MKKVFSYLGTFLLGFTFCMAAVDMQDTGAISLPSFITVILSIFLLIFANGICEED